VVLFIRVENRFPPATTTYLMAIIYGVGFFSLFDFALYSLSVNGLSYLNVTNMVRSKSVRLMFFRVWFECLFC
jgi:hypothetical protein